MAWGIALPPSDKKPEKKGERDRDLENVLGNLLITKFQLERLEEMLDNHIEYTGSRSKFMFKHKDSWFNVELIVNKEKPKKEDEDEELKKAFESSP